MKKKLITQLKEEFYAWCYMLSINELASNPQLIRTIEKIERRLVREECKAAKLAK